MMKVIEIIVLACFSIALNHIAEALLDMAEAISQISNMAWQRARKLNGQAAHRKT